MYKTENKNRHYVTVKYPDNFTVSYPIFKNDYNPLQKRYNPLYVELCLNSLYGGLWYYLVALNSVNGKLWFENKPVSERYNRNYSNRKLVIGLNIINMLL